MNQLAGQQVDQMAVIIRPGGWGAKKGGLEKFARCGCNLTLRDRMKGGKIVGKSQSTQHLGHIGSVGGVNSVKSGSNARRKVLGQFGMMYNELEKECLAALLQAGFVVDYEPIVFVGERRIIPDFRVGDVYIECTGDPKVNAKAERFLEKFELIEKYEGACRAIVVTTPNLVERYMLYLGQSASVTTTEGLVDALLPSR